MKYIQFKTPVHSDFALCQTNAIFLIALQDVYNSSQFRALMTKNSASEN